MEARSTDYLSSSYRRCGYDRVQGDVILHGREEVKNMGRQGRDGTRRDETGQDVTSTGRDGTRRDGTRRDCKHDSEERDNGHRSIKAIALTSS